MISATYVIFTLATASSVAAQFSEYFRMIDRRPVPMATVSKAYVIESKFNASFNHVAWSTSEAPIALSYGSLIPVVKRKASNRRAHARAIAAAPQTSALPTQTITVSNRRALAKNVAAAPQITTLPVKKSTVSRRALARNAAAASVSALPVKKTSVSRRALARGIAAAPFSVTLPVKRSTVSRRALARGIAAAPVSVTLSVKKTTISRRALAKGVAAAPLATSLPTKTTVSNRRAVAKAFASQTVSISTISQGLQLRLSSKAVVISRRQQSRNIAAEASFLSGGIASRLNALPTRARTSSISRRSHARETASGVVSQTALVLLARAESRTILKRNSSKQARKYVVLSEQQIEAGENAVSQRLRARAAGRK